MFTKSLFIYVLSSLALVTSSSGAQIPTMARRDTTQRQIFTPALSTAFEKSLLAGHVPGMAVTAVFADDSSNPQFATYGNRTEDGDAVEKETLFFIGSSSKSFLTAAMGILMDDFASGKNTTALPAGVKSFTWDTKVHDLINGASGAEWHLEDPFSTERANVRDLLSHVTGLSGHDLYYRNVDSIQDMINRQQFLKQNKELRETWQYNNAMYITGSHIIATYAGMPFTQFVQERILTPLNMTNAFYFPSRVPSNLDISQSFSGLRRTELFSKDDRLAELVAGAGGLLTNVVEMSKWIAMLLNGGVNPANNQTIIPKAGFNEVTTGHVVDNSKATAPALSVSAYGMGWDRFSYRGHEVVIHTGGITGYLSVTAFFPNDGVAVFASLNNGRAVQAITEIAFNLFDSILGLPPNTIFADADGTSFHPSLSGRADTSSPSSSSNATVDLSAYTGNYSNAGYGNITFCAPDSTFGDCPQVLANFSTIIPYLNSTPGLYASWDRFWTSQAMLVPNSGNQWNFSTFNIYPNGFGKDTTPFTDSIFLTPFPALFDTDGGSVQGFGLFGGVIGALLETETDANLGVKDRAEVYFTKQ